MTSTNQSMRRSVFLGERKLPSARLLQSHEGIQADSSCKTKRVPVFFSSSDVSRVRRYSVKKALISSVFYTLCERPRLLMLFELKSRRPPIRNVVANFLRRSKSGAAAWFRIPSSWDLAIPRSAQSKFTYPRQLTVRSRRYRRRW